MPLDATGFEILPGSPAENARVLQALQQARHRIRYRWLWRQDARFGLSLCAVNALTRIEDDDAIQHACHRRLAAQLLKRDPFLLGGAAEQVMLFNDHPLTRHADVLALFDRAIAAMG